MYGMGSGIHILLSVSLLFTPVTGHDAGAQEAPAIVAGTVSVAGPDGQPVVLPGVVVTLTCNGAAARTEVTNERGEFRFADAGSGTCSIVADLEGFTSAAKVVALQAGQSAAVTLLLGLDTLHEDVMVSARSDTADSPIAAHVE